MNQIKYKVIYNPVKFRPEFLEAQAKRQAVLYMKIQELDGQIALDELRDRYRTCMWPYIVFVPLGAILGGIIGLVVTHALLGL